jgi:hypothetical protein
MQFFVLVLPLKWEQWAIEKRLFNCNQTHNRIVFYIKMEEEASGQVSGEKERERGRENEV